MKFIPRYGRVEIEPIKDETLFLGEEKKFIEKGKVITLGSGVISCEVGDIIYFDSYGVYQTPEVDGESHWVVRGEEYIIGKDGK